MKTDAQIKTDVLDELNWDPQIDHSQIGVIVKDGAVTLTGHVPTYLQRNVAKMAAQRVSGVHAIVNEIEVELPSEHRMSDEGLAERVAHVLRWNVSTSGRDIRAEVKGGVVTLRGKLDRNFQRANILRNLEHVSGVKAIVDHMTIEPQVSIREVQEEIKAALNRHAEFGASNIDITTSGGTVILEGTVESLDEMDRIKQAAWAAPGVHNVVDNLRVV
ncbi:MAG: BON domain-containing protein [Pseudomonadota bacterium]